jgi:predicted ribosomally synthesized peptide with SipW-like signal peptide
MNTKPQSATLRSLLAILCATALLPGDTLAYMSSSSQASASSPQNQASKIPAEQLDSLVAPIALYPDPLLAQSLAASTYPLEIIQLQQWLEKNKNLKDKALADAVAKQPWDASIQALAALPDVVKRLADDIQWTADLGNAFLAQQSDVMDAVQRMRKKAQDKGNLKSTEQQKVETKVIESKSVIVVEQANPQVIYVPSYDPVVVYGPAYYPYPPIYYPPAGYYAAGVAIAFGVGIAMGAFWGGGWGWGCGWGGNDININRNNNFNRNTNIGGGNRGNVGNRPSNPVAGGGNRANIGGNRASTLPAGGRGAGNRWQHNPQHRGGAPYRDRSTADRFGGTTRGDSLANRQASARQQVGRQGGNLPSNRAGSGMSNRAGEAGVSNRGGGGGLGNRSGGGGADRIGSRDLSRSGGGNRDAFGGGSRGYSGSNARGSSSRGASSMGSRGGGGFSRGGGGRRR